MDQRQFLARLERQGAHDFADAIRRAGAEEEQALRAYFGEQELETMKALAAKPGAATRKGNVAVLHGIMGSELSYEKAPEDLSGIWLNVLHLLLGDFNLLPLAEDGRSLFPVVVSGILKSYYGKLILSLAPNWDVHDFTFDWRADISQAADDLLKDINNRFGEGEPVHFVAHSMGGLVVRAFIKKHPRRWESMWKPNADHAKGGRLIMLGTPNWGSFAIPLLYLGLNGMLKMLAEVGHYNGSQQLLHVAKTFIGTYQMLPSTDKVPDPNAARLYDPSTYEPLDLPEERFNRANAFKQEIAGVSDPERMVYVAGFDQRTVVGVSDWNNLTSPDSYTYTLDGDGTVPHKLGLLPGVPNYFVKEEHSKLPKNDKVIAAVEDLLATGTTGQLPDQLPPRPQGLVAGIERAVEGVVQGAEEVAEAVRGDELQRLAGRLGSARLPGGELPEFSEDERSAADALVRGFSIPLR